MKLMVLPEELRSELKAPLGTLCRGDGVQCVRDMENDLRAATRVAAVGDMTTFYLFEGSIMPDLLIVDNKTKRMPVPDEVRKNLDHDAYRTIEIENPPATLNTDFNELIERSLAGRERIKIVVKGEEDLATLPAILYAPLGSAVVYGQPNEGMVIVKVTPEKKEYIRNLMKRMILKE